MMQVFIKSFWGLCYGFLLFSIVTINYSCLAQSSGSDDEKYNKKLNEVILNIQQKAQIHESDILEIMPNTLNAATIFYRYDYDGRTSKAFQTLNMLIAEKASSNSEILSRYLMMSQFVDGYFAESYFDRIETIAKNTKEVFCDEYDKLDPKYVSRLVTIYNKYCEKNIPR